VVEDRPASQVQATFHEKLSLCSLLNSTKKIQV
jgi:hypothetical protein